MSQQAPKLQERLSKLYGGVAETWGWWCDGCPSRCGTRLKWSEEAGDNVE